MAFLLFKMWLPVSNGYTVMLSGITSADLYIEKKKLPDLSGRALNSGIENNRIILRWELCRPSFVASSFRASGRLVLAIPGGLMLLFHSTIEIPSKKITPMLGVIVKHQE
jgi:hypothetical protein